ncbi:hypothetical protein Pgy4_31936, partial [Pseudomonas savastanoi pv. glycinea str. race 4]
MSSLLAQLRGALFDLLLQCFIETPQLRLGLLAFGDVRGHACQRTDQTVLAANGAG